MIDQIKELKRNLLMRLPKLFGTNGSKTAEKIQQIAAKLDYVQMMWGTHKQMAKQELNTITQKEIEKCWRLVNGEDRGQFELDKQQCINQFLQIITEIENE